MIAHTTLHPLARLAIRPEWPAWAVLAIGVLAVAGAVAAYAWSTRPIPPRRKALLIGLRCVAVAAAMATLLRPSAMLDVVNVERAAVALVLDATGSMVIEDAGGGASRIARLQEALGENAALVERIAATYRLERYEMDTALRGVERFGFRTDGRGTDIGGSLSELLAKARAQPYAGVVLMTDGAQNVGSIDPAALGAAFRMARAPVVAVGVGSDEASAAVRDIVARSIEVPQRVFEGNAFAGRARFTIRGFRDTPIPIRVQFGDAEPQTIIVTPADDEVHVQPSFTCEAIEEGIHKLTVEAEPQPGELRHDNNSISAYVRVARGEARVLLVQGQLRYEELFLRRALANVKDLDLDLRIVVGQGHDPATLPQTPAQWRRYAVVLLGDVSREAFTAESLDALREAVAGGVGFAMLGGRRNYAAGFAGTPVAELLPVRLMPGDEQFEGSYGVTPSRDDLDHYILQVDDEPQTSRRLIEALPNLDGGVAVAGPTPVGRALLMCNKTARRPILVVGGYGADGRTAALLADTTWKWAFQPDDAHREVYQRLWRQLMMWLAHRDTLADDQAWLVLDKTRYHLGLEAVAFRAFAENAAGASIDDAHIEIAIRRIAGGAPITATVPLRHTASGYLAAWDPPETGDYEVRMTARRGGEPLGEQTERLQVYLSDIELDEPQANPTLLKTLAAASDGRYATPAELGDALRELLEKDANIEVTTTQPSDLWDTWPMMLLFLTALTAEWTLRKRGGLA